MGFTYKLHCLHPLKEFQKKRFQVFSQMSILRNRKPIQDFVNIFNAKHNFSSYTIICSYIFKVNPIKDQLKPIKCIVGVFF